MPSLCQRLLLIAAACSPAVLGLADDTPPPLLPWDPTTFVPWDPSESPVGVVPQPGPSPVSTIEPHQRAPLTADVLSAAEANNRFGLNLYQQLALRAGPDEGLLFSPLSASAALGMVYAGAGGSTAEQMRHALGYAAAGADNPHLGLGGLANDLNDPREGYELRLANRVFVQDGLPLEQGFLDTLTNDYRAPVEQLDFYQSPEASRRRINAWAADATNDRIKDPLPPGSITQDTRLALANALYFNGDWKRPFVEENTRDLPFNAPDGSQSLTPMMRQTSRFRYGEYDGYQMLEMPYAGDDMSMVVMLPDAESSVIELEQSLAFDDLSADLAEAAYREVAVSMPRFGFEGGGSIRSALVALGMTDAFGAGADLTGMADQGLAVSDVIQKTFIDVNEHGAEAAAVTIGVIAVTDVQSSPPPPAVFTADRPFLYAIRDTHSGAFLFMGRMVNPELSGVDEAAVPEPAALLLAWLSLGSALCVSGLRITRTSGAA